MKLFTLFVLLFGCASVSFSLEGIRVVAEDSQGDCIGYREVNVSIPKMRVEIANQFRSSEMEIIVGRAGPTGIDITLPSRKFSDTEKEALDKLVSKHDEEQSLSGQFGIEDEFPNSTLPHMKNPSEEWKQKFSKAKNDSERLSIIAEYLGFSSDSNRTVKNRNSTHGGK